MLTSSFSNSEDLLMNSISSVSTCTDAFSVCLFSCLFLYLFVWLAGCLCVCVSLCLAVGWLVNSLAQSITHYCVPACPFTCLPTCLPSVKLAGLSRISLHQFPTSIIFIFISPRHTYLLPFILTIYSI